MKKEGRKEREGSLEEGTEGKKEERDEGMDGNKEVRREKESSRIEEKPRLECTRESCPKSLQVFFKWETKERSDGGSREHR